MSKTFIRISDSVTVSASAISSFHVDDNDLYVRTLQDEVYLIEYDSYEEALDHFELLTSIIGSVELLLD